MINRMKKLICLLIVAVVMSGCATFVKNNWYEQSVKITSEPKGANIIINGEPRYIYKYINLPNGGATAEKTEQLVSTPSEVSLEINNAPYVLRLEKDGFEPVDIKITQEMSGWSVLNLINVIGWDIDHSTGAIDTLKPGSIHVVLKKKTSGDIIK